MRFVPDPDFEKNLTAAVQPALDCLQASIDHIANTQAGAPQSEILASLTDAAREAGVNPNESEMAKLAEAISQARTD